MNLEQTTDKLGNPQKSSTTILIVDDERGIRSSLKRLLEESNYHVIEAKNGREAMGIIQRAHINLVLMDVKMSGITGIEALKEIKKINPKQLVIIMTAYGTTQTAIEAMKFGAFEYILKPFDIPTLENVIKKALQVDQLMKNPVSYKAETYKEEMTDHIIGNSFKMQEIYKLIGQVSEENITVLLRGESGTGKELVARAIYHNSKRNNKTYLTVNCAAIPETLLESELFGHEKGAFTNAQNRRIGKFEQCNGGTTFLDEIGDMSMPTQAKILRVLQEQEITRLGSNDPIPIDVRLIVATNKNLEQEIKKGFFREDLYYRLNVISLHLPPLRERKEDIPELAHYFLARFRQTLKKNILSIEPQALEKLIHYDWPGNVRELENVLKRAFVLCKGSYIINEELPLPEKSAEKITDLDLPALADMMYKKILKAPQKDKQGMVAVIEKEFIKKAILDNKGNQLKAAKTLGMNRITLHNKIKKYGLKISKAIQE